jgi:hypothetical protein
MATTTRSSNIAIDFDLNGLPVIDKVREVKENSGNGLFINEKRTRWKLLEHGEAEMKK